VIEDVRLVLTTPSRRLAHHQFWRGRAFQLSGRYDSAIPVTQGNVHHPKSREWMIKLRGREPRSSFV
jgi:hypothetical protein